MNKSERVSLLVNGVEYGGWLSAQIVSGLQQIATQFAVDVTEKYPGGAVRIRPGDKVVVMIGDATIATGYVDKTPVSYDAGSVTHSVSGRSMTADLADCCIETGIETATKTPAKKADSGRYAGIEYRADGTRVDTTANRSTVSAVTTGSQWQKIDAAQTIAAMLKPYGLKLKTDIGAVIVDKVSVSVGTKVADAIKQLVQKLSLLATDDEFGNLVLWSPAHAVRAADSLVAGEDGLETNILSASCDFNYESVFSDYVIFGQAKSDKSDSTGGSANVFSDVTHCSALGNRHRVLKLFESGNLTKAIADKRAAFESAYRLGSAKAVSYTVQGWRQSDGSLWRKGLIVTVKDAILGFDEEMIIQRVTYNLSESGTTAVLDLVSAITLRTADSDGWQGVAGTKAPVGATSAEAS
jgi:prophage tail gpP-like protein